MRIARALEHEEIRCAFLSQQAQTMMDIRAEYNTYPFIRQPMPVCVLVIHMTCV
jgi:hypothetical protein